MNRLNLELQLQLAQAFGLQSPADVETLIAALRSGGEVDLQTLRKGCLALVENVREARSAHAETDKRLTIALEAADMGFWEWDVQTNEVFVDHMYGRFLGLGDEERVCPLGKLAEAVHPEDRVAFRAALQAAVSGAAPKFQIDHRVRHADGKWVWIETSGDVTQRAADGSALQMAGTHANITERKQLERALSNTLRVMHALLETLPLPVIIRDVDRRVTMVNAAWEAMLGVPRHDIIGKVLDHDPRRAKTIGHRETDDEIIATKKPLRYETTIRPNNGAVFSVLIAKTPLIAEDGSIVGIASVITDISEQKLTAAALERARVSAEAAVHAKSRFLANMSHELRTPLNGVVGMASLLENTALDAKQRRFVRTLKSSAEALITLINDVLDLSKAEAGKLELSREPFELRRELEQVIGLFGARAHDKNIEIAAHIARDVPATLRGDSIRLRQVLGNLVNNAVKFTEGGAVLLAVTVVPGSGEAILEFSVTDTGVGVMPAEHQRIFEAFEQADGSVTRKFGGTGLGLAISRQLVDLMHGSMDMESEPGRGSRFSFRVPAGVPRIELPHAAPPADLGAISIGLHPVIRGAVHDVLSLESAQVIDAASTAEAIEALRNFGGQVKRIRAVIDSSAAPRMEQTVNALRAAAAPWAVDVIALLPPDADATPAHGVNRVLVKPLCTIDLLQSQASADTAQSTRVRILPASGSRGRALVVEDNAVNQEMARAMLDMLGFNVTTASNGREGVQAAAADPELDLILMDCQMPVMDGLAAARAIRAAESEGIRIPIVALTGNAMPGDREACVAAGMDDYLAKPFSLTALKAMIDKWTGGATLAGSAVNAAGRKS